MARLSSRSAVAIPLGLVAVGALSAIGWLASHVVDIERRAAVSDRDIADHGKSIDAMQPKLDAIPRIQEDVEWIRAEMSKRAGSAGPGDQAKR